ncbi:protein cueball-like [Anneissia japonica]|uniref:protein cueball-like n=1 Tax=Anneissia japonica TaxID=1529436 RepID=UPI001425AE59|nr:protein cueball-like [Anneissia japonica]
MANFLSLIKVCVLISVTATQVGFSLGRDVIFAAHYSGIYISDIDHSNPSDLNLTKIQIEPMVEPGQLAYNPSTSTIYFTNRDEMINKYSLKNKSLETFISRETDTRYEAIAIDVTKQRLYFGSLNSDVYQIEVINLDGTDRITLIPNIAGLVRGIQIDAVNGYLYWSTSANNNIPAAISRVRLDNLVSKDILINTSLSVTRLELDVEGKLMRNINNI